MSQQPQHKEQFLQAVGSVVFQNLEASADFLIKLAKLMKKNQHLKISGSFLHPPFQFPALRSKPSYDESGVIIATLSLRDGAAEIFYPCSTNPVVVAAVTSGYYGHILEIRSINNSVDGSFERIIQADEIVSLPQVDKTVIEKLFENAAADIREAFGTD